jgi:CDP-6-deoxy-D-xylo-4-hexulose-3-dehydrase
MSVKEDIHIFLNSLREKGENVFPFLYNAKMKDFNPEKDWVFYSGPYWGDDEIAAAMESLITGKWIAAGENVNRFEKNFSKKYNFAASLMVNSGSSANLVMIAALKKRFDWQNDDEIIVSPVGFPTTVAPLVQNGLKPVFTDITYHDLNFDLDQVEKKINAKTKAIFVSPVLGNSPDIDRILKICEDKNIKLILDGCDSLGSKWKGKDLSDYAVATSCSFYPAHHITTGEGGMVSSNDEEIVKIARRFAWWGRDCYCTGSANLSPKGACGKRFDTWLEGYDKKVDHKYLFSEMGYNLKPLELQGSIGLVQLEKADDIHEKRRSVKASLEVILKKHLGDRISIPQEMEGAETSWFGVPIICKENKLKQMLVEHFEGNRIQTRNYFAGNILMHPGYKDLDSFKNYPLSNRVLEEVFFIGCHPSYNEKVFARLDDVLSKFKG